MEGEDELPHYSGVILAKYLQNLDGNIASLQTSLIEARMCRAPVLSPQDVSKTLSEDPHHQEARIYLQSMSTARDEADNNNLYKEQNTPSVENRQLKIICDLQRELQRKTKECEYHKDSKIRAFYQLNDVRKQNLAHEDENKLLRQEVKDIEGEKSWLEQEVKDIEDENRRMNDENRWLRQEVKDLEDENKRLGQEVKTLEDEYRRLKEQVKDLGIEFPEDGIRWLKEQVKDLGIEFPEDEIRWLEQHLKDFGIEFPEDGKKKNDDANKIIQVPKSLSAGALTSSHAVEQIKDSKPARLLGDIKPELDVQMESPTPNVEDTEVTNEKLPDDKVPELDIPELMAPNIEDTEVIVDRGKPQADKVPELDIQESPAPNLEDTEVTNGKPPADKVPELDIQESPAPNLEDTEVTNGKPPADKVPELDIQESPAPNLEDTEVTNGKPPADKVPELDMELPAANLEDTEVTNGKPPADKVPELDIQESPAPNLEDTEVTNGKPPADKVPELDMELPAANLEDVSIEKPQTDKRRTKVEHRIPDYKREGDYRTQGPGNISETPVCLINQRVATSTALREREGYNIQPRYENEGPKTEGEDQNLKGQSQTGNEQEIKNREQYIDQVVNQREPENSGQAQNQLLQELIGKPETENAKLNEGAVCATKKRKDQGMMTNPKRKDKCRTEKKLHKMAKPGHKDKCTMTIKPRYLFLESYLHIGELARNIKNCMFQSKLKLEEKQDRKDSFKRVLNFIAKKRNQLAHPYIKQINMADFSDFIEKINLVKKDRELLVEIFEIWLDSGRPLCDV